MFKKILLTAFLAGFALSANAQIATPSLNAGYHTYGGAAAGWRYGSTVNLVGLSMDGKVEVDGTELGDVTVGMNAKGPEDSSSPIPFFLGAYRGDMFAAELYTNLSDGLKRDLEISAGTDEIKVYTEETEMRVNFAYVFGEVLSIGVGYYSIGEKEKQQQSSTSPPAYSVDKVSDTTKNGTSATASFRIAEIFFIAAGMDMVSQTGTDSCEDSLGGAICAYDSDFADNSWTETMYGAGVLIGEPGDTQFRVEYSMISSPESVKTESGKAESAHPQTTTTFATAEAKFGDFLVGYQSTTETLAELNNQEQETTITSAGIGWQPMEGLSVSLYSIDSKRINKDSSSGEFVINPKGYRFFVGYNF